MHNNQRSEKILACIRSEMTRLGLTPNVRDFINYYVVEFLPASVVLKYRDKFEKEVDALIFDDDIISMESLKVIGLMEISNSHREFKKLLVKKGEILYTMKTTQAGKYESKPYRVINLTGIKKRIKLAWW